MSEEELEAAQYYGGRATKWPVIWGVVAIVFGVVGFLAQAVTAFQSGAMLYMPKMMEGNLSTTFPKTGDPAQDKIMEQMMTSQQQMMEKMAEIAPMTMTAAIVQAVIAIILVVGGILLCMRKRVSSPVLQVWAGLKIVAAFFAVWAGYQMSMLGTGMYSDLMSTMSRSSPGPSSMPDFGGIMQVFVQVMLVVQLLWMLWLPIYFFILFNRPAIKEDMEHGPGWVKAGS